MYPSPGSWVTAPQLIVDHDFDNLIASGTVSTAGNFLYSSADRSWVVTAQGANGTMSVPTPADAGHIGVISIATSATNGTIAAVGIDVGQSNLTAPIGLVLANKVLRWDWWVTFPSLTSVNYRLGISDSWTGTLDNSVYINMDTNTSTNLFIVTILGGTATITDTGVAATAGYNKFTGIYGPNNAGTFGWYFYRNDALLGFISTNLPTAPVVPGCFVRTRSAAVRSMRVDKCMVWSEGTDILT